MGIVGNSIDRVFISRSCQVDNATKMVSIETRRFLVRLFPATAAERLDVARFATDRRTKRPLMGYVRSMKKFKVVFCAISLFMLLALVAIIATTFGDGEDGTFPCIMILLAGVILIGFIYEEGKPCK